MMRNTKRMDQIKAILSSYLESPNIKATARKLGVSKNTVRSYLQRARTINSDLKFVLEMDETELAKLLLPVVSVGEQSRARYFQEHEKEWLKELPRVGVTRHRLWEEYQSDQPGGYGYSQFCARLQKAIARKDLTLALTHVPGETMMVDFAGKKLHYVDPSTGEVIYTEILVVCMPHSQYTFVVALASQKIADFVDGLQKAFVFFGRIPRVILSDNLKSYVTKANRYEPKFTELCEQLAAHYQVELRATRVAKPKDKASVENAVRIAYQRIYAAMRNDVFYGLPSLNKGIQKHLAIHNATPFQKRPSNRKAIFDEYEYPCMRDLPSQLFEIYKSTRAKVQRNYHIFLGEEKNYYSVPYRYVGKTATVLYTAKNVEIYIDNQRIAFHTRFPSGKGYRYRTKEDHCPSNHQQWRESAGYDAAHFIEQAEKIGPKTVWAIQHILQYRVYEAQSYQSCNGVLSLTRKYGPTRLENAAARCHAQQKVNYYMLKNILEKGLDNAEPEVSPGIPEHNNIRGKDNYQ